MRSLRSLALALVTFLPLAAQTAPRHLRLLWHERPATEAIVSWSTEGPPGEARVLVGQAPGFAADEARVFSVTRSGPFSGQEELHHVHVVLKGLDPGRRHWLRIEGPGGPSPEYWFRTAPDEDVEVCFLSGGDSRSDREMRRKVNARIARLLKERPEILCLAHGGDYIVSGRDLGQWIGWLDDHQATITEDRRLLPVIPARGNHEARGPLYDEVFFWPGGGEGRNWFTTRLSPQVCLVTLDTNVPAGGEQRAFLERTLRENADVRWKTAQYHRPLYPAVKRPARAKRHWLPLFDELGVSLAMENDGHVLRRTVRLKGDRPDPEGVLYIGEGGMGVPQRKPRDDRSYYTEGGFAASAHHVWIVTLGERVGVVEAVSEKGRVLDRASFTPRR